MVSTPKRTEAEEANHKEAEDRPIETPALPDEASESTKARAKARLKAVGDNSQNDTGKSYGVTPDSNEDKSNE